MLGNVVATMSMGLVVTVLWNVVATMSIEGGCNCAIWVNVVATVSIGGCCNCAMELPCQLKMVVTVLS